ncbi:hypothetical protein KFK09_009663 [Dendrobium nobile]|uniref:CCT domain-containing protein n=1 Tax=Dendrobium nobile TaxID=94219 RepID=A0A8T3BI26_DENNO|nr:hypothetical protein KFK09_009663 [Dendrobium nobile]
MAVEEESPPSLLPPSLIPASVSCQECLSSSLEDKMSSFDYEDNLFREAGYSPRYLSSTNNGVYSSDVPVTITFPEPDTNITDLLGYDNSFNSELISSHINPQPPPEPEPNSFPSLPAASMAPIHPMNQPNPMMCNPPFTSYPPNSVVSRLPLDPSGLPSYMGMEPSTMQHSSFMNANGGIGGQLYAERMRMPTCVADDGMGKYTSVGKPVQRDSQHVRPMCSTSIASLQMPSDIPRMDDSNNKVSRASPEERRKQLERFYRKKKARNFSKTIKYTCRKILADSRPRVRGRFAKIEEFSDVIPMPSFANDEEVSNFNMALMNNEDRLVDSSDILAHISEVISFDFNYPVASWL